ncbi:MAG TPA: hypothetical protein VF601_21725 [Beijerinckiaceae bacterium]|jgi:hypothetical protein
MSNPARLTPLWKPAETKPADPVQEKSLDLARAIFDSLTPELQEQFLRDLNKKARAAIPPGPRAGEVLENVIQLFRQKPSWRAADVRRLFEERGIAASAKQVFNALDYLTRTGRLQRVAYGQYLVAGGLLTGAEDLGGEPGRHEDLSDDVPRDRAYPQFQSREE